MQHERQHPSPNPSDPTDALGPTTDEGFSRSLDGSVLLRPQQACEWLGIGRSTLADLIASNQLRSLKFGRARRIPGAALREYVDAQSHGPTASTGT